jgi:small subunit ribosomal protein S16
MLIIRLQRVGRTHEPSFRIVLTDSKFGPKSGKAVEVLGSYDARKGKGTNHVDGEKVKYWISKGAQVSDTVHNYLVDEKILTGKKINVLPKNKIINAIKAKADIEKAKLDAEEAKKKEEERIRQEGIEKEKADALAAEAKAKEEAEAQALAAEEAAKPAVETVA